MGREQNNTPTNATYLLKVPVLIIFLYCLSGCLSIFPAAGEAIMDEHGWDLNRRTELAKLRIPPAPASARHVRLGQRYQFGSLLSFQKDDENSYASISSWLDAAWVDGHFIRASSCEKCPASLQSVRFPIT